MYSLFKNDINRLKIDVKYDNQRIESYLILFKGIFINNGKTDIDKSRIYKPLQLITKSDYNWLESTLIEWPEGSSISLKKSSTNILELNWDLLKAGEKIEFEALIEVPKNIEIDEISDNFYASLNFDFRITDINKIEKLSEGSMRGNRLAKLQQRTIFLGMVTVVAGCYLFFNPELPDEFALFTRKKDIEYTIVNPKKETNHVKISSNRNGCVKIENDSILKEITVADFNKHYQIREITSTLSENPLYSRIIGASYLFMGIILIVRYISRNRKRRSSKNLIERN